MKNDIPYCAYSGCEALTSTCHVNCPNSVMYPYKLKGIVEVLEKLISQYSVEHQVVCELFQELGIRKEIVSTYKLREAAREGSVTMIGGYQIYSLVMLYDVHGKHDWFIVDFVEADHRHDGEFVNTHYYSTLIPLHKLIK